MDMSNLHLINKSTMDRMSSKLNEAAAAPMAKFGLKMLQKHGWSEGEGVGKNKQGLVSHIKVTKKETETGLGYTEEKIKKEVSQWWNSAYNTALDTVNQSNDSSDSESDENDEEGRGKIPTDAELFAATGGKLIGRRGYANQKGKIARVEQMAPTLHIKAQELRKISELKILKKVEPNKIEMVVNKIEEGEKEKKKEKKEKKRKREEEKVQDISIENEIASKNAKKAKK